MVTTMKTLWKRFSTNLDAPLTYQALIVFAVWLFAVNSAAASGAPAQATFATPAEAGQALQGATRADNEDELRRILGPDSQNVVSSGDAAADKAAMQSFATKYNQMNRWVAMTDGSEVLYIGADNYPFPVPLAKNSDSRWYFDMAAGKQEILARRVGRNDLLAIDGCFALAKAEKQYFRAPRNGNSVREYARRVISNDGRQDGLYWPPASAKQSPSPLAILAELPNSSVDLLAPGQPLVLDGYILRILTAQGDAAPGGAKSYIVNGKMTGGFAILATPLKYGKTGIMTFMSGSDGAIYEQDLGLDTFKIAASTQEFNPTSDWSPVE
jgi:hypothetical protein